MKVMTDIEIENEIEEAIDEDEMEKVRALLKADKKRLTWTTPSGTWLHIAAASGRLEILKMLLKMGLDVNRRAGRFGGAPINEAASRGHLEVVKELLAQGAKLDVSEVD